jgi:hypothetical protein
MQQRMTSGNPLEIHSEMDDCFAPIKPGRTGPFSRTSCQREKVPEFYVSSYVFEAAII